MVQVARVFRLIETDSDLTQHTAVQIGAGDKDIEPAKRLKRETQRGKPLDIRVERGRLLTHEKAVRKGRAAVEQLSTVKPDGQIHLGRDAPPDPQFTGRRRETRGIALGDRRLRQEKSPASFL